MKKTSLKTRIMSIVAAAVMACSTAAVSMASASAASVDSTVAVAQAKKSSSNIYFKTNVHSVYGSYICLYVWDNNGHNAWVKPSEGYGAMGMKYFEVPNDYNWVGGIFANIKGYTEPGWNNGSIMAQTKDYDYSYLQHNNVDVTFGKKESGDTSLRIEAAKWDDMSYIAAYVWNSDNDHEWIKMNYDGNYVDIPSKYTHVIVARVKGYSEPNWNNLINRTGDMKISDLNGFIKFNG